jgi:hypothetical protein
MEGFSGTCCLYIVAPAAIFAVGLAILGTWKRWNDHE